MVQGSKAAAVVGVDNIGSDNRDEWRLIRTDSVSIAPTPRTAKAVSDKVDAVAVGNFERGRRRFRVCRTARSGCNSATSMRLDR